MKRTNIHLPDDMRAWLMKNQRKTGTPMAEFVRKAIEAAMKKAPP